MMVAHFVLGPAHLVCASACVCCLCHLCTLHTPCSTLVGTLQWGHQDAIFMDCCMILKVNKTVYRGRGAVNYKVNSFVNVSVRVAGVLSSILTRRSGGEGMGETEVSAGLGTRPLPAAPLLAEPSLLPASAAALNRRPSTPAAPQLLKNPKADGSGEGKGPESLYLSVPVTLPVSD